MDTTVDCKQFADALKLVKAGVPKHCVMSVLTGARLEAALDELTVTTSSIDVTVVTKIPASVAATGTVVASHGDLAKLIKGKGSVQLIAADDQLAIRNGATMALRTLPADEFPFTPTPADDEVAVPLDLDAVASVLPGYSRDDTRPILTGVLFGGGHDRNEIVSTDSYRLHVARLAEAIPVKVLVPGSALSLVVKNGKPATMFVSPDGRVVRIEAENATWHVRTIEGDFPNYTQLIPSSYPFRLLVERAKLIDAVKTVEPLAKEAAPVRLNITSDGVVLSAITQDVGEAKSDVVPGCWTGGDLTVAFNPAFLLACLETGHGDTVALDLLDTLKPAVFTDPTPIKVSGRGKNAVSYQVGYEGLRLLMPVRVS